MSKTAIISDPHANLEGLKAVLAEVAEAEIDSLVCGGDIVGYGAQPRECLELLREIGGQAVLGNHDHYAKIINEKGKGELPDGWEHNPVWAGVARAVDELNDEQMAWLGDRPWVLHLEGGALLAHASLHEPDNWRYLSSEKSALPTLEILREQGIGVGFFGHTHRINVFSHPSGEQAKRIDENHYRIPDGANCAITVGSVGQPREQEDWRATWAIWDSEEHTVEFRRTSYDCQSAAKSILDAGLPALSALRLLPPQQRSQTAENLGIDRR